MAEINYGDNGNILSRTDYDDSGRITAYTEYDGDSGKPVMTIDYRDDRFPVVITRYEYDGNGILSLTNTENYGPRMDVESRDVTVYDRSGNIESVTSYDVVNGENGTRTETARDEDGRVIEVIQYGIDNFADGIVMTAYEYDRNGNISKEETRSNVLYFGGRVADKYDEVRPVETITYDRDSDGRITAEDHIYHDDMGNYDEGRGEIVRWDRIEYEYGEGGVTRQNLYEGTFGSRFETEYDEKGNRTTVTEYDREGNVAEKNIYDSDGNIREIMRYDEGRMTYEEKNEDGVRTSVDYNGNGDPETKIVIDSGKQSVTGFEYVYDRGGGIKILNEVKYENLSSEYAGVYFSREIDTYEVYRGCSIDEKMTYRISRSYNENGEQAGYIRHDYVREDKEIVTWYDKDGAVTSRRDLDLDIDGNTAHAVVRKYDEDGKIISVTEYGGEPAVGIPKTMICRTVYDEDGTAVRIEYDKDGKAVLRTEIKDVRIGQGDDSADVDSEASGPEVDADPEDGGVDSDDGDSVD